MSLTSLHTFPPIDEQASDWCFLHTGDIQSVDQHYHYLCYEKRRDYLSVPRTHIILGLLADEDFCLDFDPDVSGLFLNQEEQFFLMDSAKSGTAFHCVIHAGSLLLELICTHLKLVKTVYHAKNAQSALAQFVSESC